MLTTTAAIRAADVTPEPETLRMESFEQALDAILALDTESFDLHADVMLLMAKADRVKQRIINPRDLPSDETPIPVRHEIHMLTNGKVRSRLVEEGDELRRLESLVVRLSACLTDEECDWSNDELNRLRHEVAVPCPCTICPTGYTHIEQQYNPQTGTNHVATN